MRPACQQPRARRGNGAGEGEAAALGAGGARLDASTRLAALQPAMSEVGLGGEYVFRQGDPGDRFYVIVSGRAEAVRVSLKRARVRRPTWCGSCQRGRTAARRCALRRGRATADEASPRSRSRRFEAILGPLESRIADAYDKTPTPKASKQAPDAERPLGWHFAVCVGSRRALAFLYTGASVSRCRLR